MSSFTITLPPGPFSAYIFDCDGTLADTMPTHFRAWSEALGGASEFFPEALFYELGGTPTNQIVALLNQRNGLTLDVDDVVTRKEALFLSYSDTIAAIEPVVAVAREMSERGLPLAVASGGHRNIVLSTLKGLKIDHLFQVVIGSEDYVNGKPAPDPFLLAAQRLGVPPEECLVFEDTLIGIEAAKAAGMKWVHVPTPERVAAFSE